VKEAPQVNKVLKEHKVLLGFLVKRDLLDFQDHRVEEVRQDLLVNLELR